MKLHNILYTILLLTFSLSLQAQVKVKGYVKADDDTPIEFANIFLTTDSSDKINGTTSGDDGSFELNATKNTYKLTVSTVGYDTYTADIAANDDVNLGAIKLKTSAQKLNESVVTAKLIERKSDRFVMNVQGNPTTAGKNMVELLSSAPSVWIDKQSGISINGKTDIKIMVNDRFVNMSTDELIAYLESLKAEDIQSVEIITDPGVEYAADASSGILHIKLKKGRAGGLTGSVGMGAGIMRDRIRYNPNLNLNYRKNKLSLYSSLSLYGGEWMGDNSSTTLFLNQNRKLTNVLDEQETYKNWRGNFGAVYELTDKHEVGFTIEGRLNDFDVEVSSINEIFESDNLVKKTTTFNNGNISFGRYDVSLNYKFKMDTLGSNLKVFLDYNKNNTDRDKKWNLFENNNLAADSIYKILLNSDYDIYALRVDYLKKFNTNTSIAFGGRYGYAEMLYKSKQEDWDNNQWEEDARFTDDYIYKENIGALYAKFDSKWGNLAYTLGLRYENTSLNISEQYSPSYNDFFPSIFLKYTFNNDKGHFVTANYNRKLTRPYYTALNPFKEYEDEYTYRTGNPNLKPTYVNTYALGATFFDKYILTFQYTQYTDVVNYITQAAPELDMSMMIPKNIDKTHMYYISLYAPVKVAKWYNFTFNISTSKRKYESVITNEQNWGCFANTQHNFILPKGWSVDLSGWFASKRSYSNMDISAMAGINGGISKKLLDNKLVVSGNVWNIQGRRYGKYTYKADNYIKNERGLNQNQVFNLSVSYNFSAGKKVDVKKVERDNEEESRLN